MTAQTLDLPFRLRDRPGTVHVEVTRNDDPDALGHGLVAVGYDPEVFKGFPIIEARIDYAGAGPRAWMGWLQTIVRHDDDGGTVSGVDVTGLFGDESPLYSFGYRPTFSDFPANPGHPDGRWVADAFLVAIPDVVRSRVLDPVLGFRWGYRLEGGRCAERFAPEVVAGAVWEEHRALLEAEYPTWTYLPAWS